jgi:N-acetylglucosaminyl-diphospho-decaprenol L-rhamnosyltransferase
LWTVGEVFMTSPRLDVLIVTASGCHGYIGPCLESLRRAPLSTGAQRVTVLDNSSKDGTEAVVAGYPEVRWRPMGRNAGFSTANNVGLRESHAEYVLLLNPDTEVGVGTLDACMHHFEQDLGIGIVGCRLLNRDGRPDANAKRTLPTPGAALRRLSFADRVLGASAYHTPAMGFDDCGPVEAVSGSFMMIRRSVLEQIGLLDEGYWMYGEDLDLCARAIRAGWMTWYEGLSTTLHIGGGAAGHPRKLRPTIAFHHGMGRYYRRHLGGRRAALDLGVYGAIGVRLGASLAFNSLTRLALVVRRQVAR